MPFENDGQLLHNATGLCQAAKMMGGNGPGQAANGLHWDAN